MLLKILINLQQSLIKKFEKLLILNKKEFNEGLSNLKNLKMLLK